MQPPNASSAGPGADLAASAAVLGAVFETLQDALIVIDERAVVVRVNAAACQLFGYERTELIGASVSMLMPKSVGDVHDGYVARYASGGKPGILGIGRTVEARRRDGSIIPVALQIGETRVGDRRLFTGLLRDQTEHRALVRSIEETAYKLAMAEEVAKLGHWYLRLGSAGPEWSREVFRIHGRDEEHGEPPLQEAIGYYHPEDRKTVSDAIARAIEERSRFDFECRLVRDDGELRWVRASGEVEVVDAAPYGIFGVFQDITETKAREAKLVRLSATHRAILASAQESIICTDSDGVITIFSDGACSMLGYEAAEIVGRTPDLLHTPDEVVQRAAELTEETGELVEPGFDVFVHRARRGDTEEREWTYVRKDGSRLTVSLSVTALRDQNGDAVGFMGVARDVTQMRQMVQALEKSRAKLATQTAQLSKTATEHAREKKRAEAANRAKSEFLAVMSHELRTPMTGVLGMVDLLQDTSLDEEQRDYVQTLGHSAQGLLNLLDDILDLSKLESGRVELERVDFRLDEVLEQVAQLLGPRASSKGLVLNFDLPVHVPRALHGDPTRLRQVLFNLVGNAIKFTSAGSVAIRADVGSTETGDMRIRLVVHDTGIGMDQEQQTRIFEPFVQADSSTSRRFGGTGLGLAICKRIVEAMGGSMEVKSTPGEGSCFAFDVVLEHAKLDVPHATDEPFAELPEGESGEGCRILLAEDTATNRFLIRRVLNKHGHDVVCAENGAEALEAFQRHEFDVVIMDMQMPVMDGPAATRAIRALGERAGEVPVLALTADAMPEHRARYEQAGLTDLLTKPIDWPRLLAAIDRHGSAQRRRDRARSSGDMVESGVPGRALERPNARDEAALASDSLPPPMDDETLLVLADTVGDDGLLEMLQMFPSELERLLAAAEQGAEASDRDAVSRAAHQMKGVGSNFGMTRLCELSAALERHHAIDGQTSEMLDALRCEALRVRGAIERFEGLEGAAA